MENNLEPNFIEKNIKEICSDKDIDTDIDTYQKEKGIHNVFDALRFLDRCAYWEK